MPIGGGVRGWLAGPAGAGADITARAGAGSPPRRRAVAVQGADRLHSLAGRAPDHRGPGLSLGCLIETSSSGAVLAAIRRR